MAQNLASSFYVPGTPPSDPQQMPRFLLEELQKIQVAINRVAEGFDPVVHVEPTKRTEGMRRNADGTNWNPGSGAGLYRFDGTNWQFLG